MRRRIGLGAIYTRSVLVHEFGKVEERLWRRCAQAPDSYTQKSAAHYNTVQYISDLYSAVMMKAEGRANQIRGREPIVVWRPGGRPRGRRWIE